MSNDYDTFRRLTETTYPVHQERLNHIRSVRAVRGRWHSIPTLAAALVTVVVVTVASVMLMMAQGQRSNSDTAVVGSTGRPPSSAPVTGSTIPKVGDCYSTAIAAPWPGTDPDASLAIPAKYLRGLGLEYIGGGPPEPRSSTDTRLRNRCGKQLFDNGWNREAESEAGPVGLRGVEDRRFEFQSTKYAQAFLSEAVPTLLQDESLEHLPQPTRLSTELALGEETLVFKVEGVVPVTEPARRELVGPEINVRLYIFQWRVDNIVAEVAVGGDELLTQKQAFAIAQAAAEQVDAALDD